jgi:hypothetical protein
MKNFLKSIGIIQGKTLHFDISPEEFFEILHKNVVDHPHREAIFQKSTHTYRGKLQDNEFRLKEVHKVFDNTRNDARIRGKVNRVEDGIEVIVETLGMAGRNIAFLLSGIAALAVLPSVIIEEESGVIVYFLASYILPVFLIVGSFVWSRNAAKKMLVQFERESFFMIEKNRKR